MKTVEGSFLQWQAGKLNDHLWHGYQEALVDMFTYNAAWRDYWEMNQYIHSEPFQKLVEATINSAEQRRRELMKRET